MRILVEADDGDEVSICADYISAEQAVVTVEIENGLYGTTGDVDCVTLTVARARELAKALLAVADAVEFVNAPANARDWTVEGSPRDIFATLKVN